MAKKRNKEHRGLPNRWRFKDGAYRYRVPAGQEHQWDGKSEFKLGVTLSEAHRTYAGRIAQGEGSIQTIAQLLDRYVYEVTPTKAPRTQKGEIKMIRHLRALIGANSVVSFSPKNAYQIRDYLQRDARTDRNRKDGKTYANHHMAVLKHVFTKSIEWGLRNDHPMINGSFKMFETSRTEMRVPTDQEVRAAIRSANPTIQAYCRLKLMTGLRRTDLLGLKLSDIRDQYLYVTPSKTAKSTGQTLRIEITPELDEVLKECKAIQPLSIFLFKTRRGQSYMSEDKGCSGFESMWQRWQSKLPKEQRFTERSLRNTVGHQGDLATASERLGHASSATTKRFYRDNVSTVTPLKFSHDGVEGG